MNETEFRILDILSREIGNPVSINRITEKIKLIYGTAHYTNIHAGLQSITKKKISKLTRSGKSIIAELYFENYLLIDHLSEMELVKKIRFLEDNLSYRFPIQELNELFQELFFIKSVLLIEPERNAKLNRMELVWIRVQSQSINAGKEMNMIRDFMDNLQRIHNMRIDYLVLIDKKFIELSKTDETNTIKEVLADKIAIFDPQKFWMEIKKASNNGVRIKAKSQKTHPAKMREIDLVFNLERFGYKEMGTSLHLDAKSVGIENVVISILVKKSSVRRLEAIPIILAKNDKRIDCSLLVFLANKYKVIRQLYEILKVLDELKPTQKIKEIKHEISDFMKDRTRDNSETIKPSLKSMEKKMRLYNVIE